MKINETTTYPHPVLSPWSDDIDGFALSTVIRFRERDDNRQISLHCEVKLDQPDLMALIDGGGASFGCYIRCQETGMRKLQRIGFPSGVHDFAPGALLGRVQIRPMIWSTRPVPGYAPVGRHSEFADPIDLPSGSILALDDEQIIDVARPPLPPIESIFEIIQSDEIEEGSFDVDMEADRITIRMAAKTFGLVQSLRQTDEASRAAIWNSLYVPVTMDVLDRLGPGVDIYESFRWYHPFMARCEIARINFDDPDLLNDAQKLLGRPFERLALAVDEEATG